MSGLGAKTKKVTTYGKKKTQIISVHSDFTPIKNTAKSPIIVSDDSPSPQLKPLARAVVRPPLRTKLSQDVPSQLNIPSTPLPSSYDKLKGKGKTVSSPIYIDSSAETVEPPVRKVARGRKNATETITIFTPEQPRQVIDCIELPSKTDAGTPKTGPSDLAEHLSLLDIQPSSSTATSPPAAAGVNSIDALLSACSTSTIIPFDDFLASEHIAELLPGRGRFNISKIGEASYSEVFSIKRGQNEAVLKIVPLFPACAKREEGDLPDCSKPEDVTREVEISQVLSDLDGGGFVDFKGVYIAQGLYPETLLKEWDAYVQECKSESIRPDTFSSDQMYALIVLSDGDVDLESFQFDKTTGWIQASGVFWQVVEALARAEASTSFEHRDLHEGQVLISPCPLTSTDSSGWLDPLSTGVSTTIIDFGLSRLNAQDNRVIWSEYPVEVYEGVGDQWDVYRVIRDEVQGDWEGYHPITNVMWLQYILRYILNSKSLRKPKLPAPTSSIPPSPTRARRVPLTRRREVKEPLVDRSAAAYEMLKGMEKALKDGLGKKRSSTSLGSASDVLQYGRDMGWIA